MTKVPLSALVIRDAIGYGGDSGPQEANTPFGKDSDLYFSLI